MFSFTLLGTGVKRPTPDRQLASVFVNFDGNRYLIDAPEGIQTTLQQHNAGTRIDAILATGLKANSLLGLPGLLQTLSHLDKSDDRSQLSELTLYVPKSPRSKTIVEKYLNLMNHECSVTVEFIESGDTVRTQENHTITATPTDSPDSVGYRFNEHDRNGEFNREKAEELGVPVGPKFGRLHDGEDVELDDGRVIKSEQVVGPARPGRTFGYTGATEHVTGLADQFRGVDVLLCDCGNTNDKHTNRDVDHHMSAYQAGTMAESANVSVLIPTHIRGTYGPNGNALIPDLNQSFDGYYQVPHDGLQYRILPKESAGRATHHSDIIAE